MAAEQKVQKISIVFHIPKNFQYDPPAEGGGKAFAKPENTFDHFPLAYYDHVKSKFAWVDEFDKVQEGSITNKTMVKVIKRKENYPVLYEVSVSPTEEPSSAKKKEALIEFFKNDPRMCHEVGNGKIDCFPTKNHQLTHQRAFMAAPEEELSHYAQPYKIVDKTVIEKTKFADLKKTQKFVRDLELVAVDPKVLEKVCFLMGLNPLGLDAGQQEQMIYDHVISSEEFSVFTAIVDLKTFDDPSKLGTHAGIAVGLITRSDGPHGNYSFDGEVIASNIEDVSQYFRINRSAYSSLRLKLRIHGQELPDEAMKAPEAPKGRPVVGKEKEVEKKGEEV